MVGVRISATAVEMDDGRPVFVVEFEPDPGNGPFVVDPLGESAAQAEDAAALREALLSPARALRANLAKMAAEEDDPFEGLSAAELVRLSATAGRVFAQVVQVERLARGLSTENGGQPLVPPEIERKSTEELRAYLVGVEDGSSDQWPAGQDSR